MIDCLKNAGNAVKKEVLGDKMFYGTLGTLAAGTGIARHLANKNYPDGINIAGLMRDSVNKSIDTINKKNDYIDRAENPGSRAVLDVKPDFDTNSEFLIRNNTNPFNYGAIDNVFESTIEQTTKDRNMNELSLEKIDALITQIEEAQTEAQKVQAGEASRKAEIDKDMKENAKAEEAKSDAFEKDVQAGTPDTPEMGPDNLEGVFESTTYVPSGLLKTYKN